MTNTNRFKVLREKLALVGVALWRTYDDEEQPQTYFAKRGRQLFHLHTIDDVESLLVTILEQAQP